MFDIECFRMLIVSFFFFDLHTLHPDITYTLSTDKERIESIYPRNFRLSKCNASVHGGEA